MDLDKRLVLWEGKAAEGVGLSESTVSCLTFNSKSSVSGSATLHSAATPVAAVSLSPLLPALLVH